MLDTRCQPGKINSKDMRTQFCRSDRSLLLTRQFHKIQFYKHINFFLSHLLHILKRDSFLLSEKKKGSFFFFFFSRLYLLAFFSSAPQTFFVLIHFLFIPFSERISFQSLFFHIQMRLIATVKVSAVVFHVVGGEEPLRNVQIKVKVELLLSVASQAVECRARQLAGDIPQLMNGDVLLFVNDAIVILIGVPPVELEELHEFVGDFGSVHLVGDVHSPLHQKREHLLLASVGVVVEFVAWLDGGGTG